MTTNGVPSPLRTNGHYAFGRGGGLTRLILFVAAAFLAVAGACGSEDDAAAPEPATESADTRDLADEGAEASATPTVLSPDQEFTIEQLEEAGWKKSKQYETETVPGAVDIWLGFFNQKDVEVRFYASHEDALTMGVEEAEKATARPDRAGGGVKGAGTFAIASYDAYVVAGNTIMLCELSAEICSELVRTATES